MKTFFSKLSLLFIMVAIASMSFITSCTTIDAGNKGVEVSWGGQTNLSEVYPEGLDWGIHWLWDDMVQYDVREKTMVETFEFNDKNNMITKVEISLDYRPDPTKVPYLHSQITDVEVKIIKTLKSAGKEVVPQYSAVELNINKRAEAEALLEGIIKKELPEFYMECIRIQMTDVDIPAAVAQLAEQTAVQLGKNELAEKMEAEKVALAKALVAESQGKYEAAQLDVKTKELMSRPAVLSLYKAETERVWAEKGVSSWGNNNVFGAGATAIIKGLEK